MKQLNKLRMKRLHLILCFLMSIIGSAWGEETTEQKETTITMSDYTSAEKEAKSITRTSDDVIFALSNLSKIDGSKGPNACAGTEFYVKVPENAVINSVSFTIGNSSSASVLSFDVYTDGDVLLQESYTSSPLKNCDMVYPSSDGNISIGSNLLTFKVKTSDESKSANFYITAATVDYTCTYTAETNNFSISDFNFVVGKNANSGLDREAGGFTFAFSGGDALKCNSSDELIFRTRNTNQNGTMKITSNTEAKIMGAEFTCTAAVMDGETNYFTITDGEGNDLTPNATVEEGVVKLSLETGVSSIVFAKKNVSETEKDNDKAFELSEIKLLTDREVTFEKITPNLTFENEEKSVVKGTATVTNVLSTTPSNFAVTYSNTEDPNSIISKIASDGTVTLNTGVTGTATITASFDGTDNKYYESASKNYTITVTSGYPSTFTVADLNYLKGANGVTANQNGLDRTIGGFTLTFAGGNAIKYNGDNNFFFRSGEGNNGTLTITPTDSENKITKVVINTSADISSVTGFSATADDVAVNSVPSGTTLPVTPTSEAGNVVISTNALSANVSIASIYIETTKQITDAMVTPTLTFANQTVDVLVGGTVSNALTTSPKNFRGVTYSSSNTDVATVDESTGAVTINAAGTATITATFAGTTYFNETSASYTLNVSNPVETTLYIADFNYNEGTSVYNGLDRENVRGYNVTFTGDANSPKFNGVASGLTLSGENATMTITPTLEGNKIISVKFTKATSGELNEAGIAASVEGNWSANDGEVTFTPTANAESITFTGNGNAFAISAMTISSTQAPFEGDYSKPTPELSFAQSSITVYSDHTEAITNTITTTPANFRILYEFEGDHSGLAIDENTGAVTLSGATAGTYTVQASFNGKRQGDNNTTNDLYNASGANVAQYQIIVKQAQTYEAGNWNFTSWTENDLAQLSAEDGNWKNDSDNRYVSTLELTADNSDNILSNIHNGLTLTAPAGKVSVYYSDAEEADGSLRLHDHSAIINLPALTAGQTIIVTTKTTSSGNARGIVFTGENADKVVLMEGSATSTEKNTVVYYVTENISGVSLTSSHNGLYIYSIVLGNASLYWMNGDEIINSIDVIESNYSTALNNVMSSITDGVTYSSDNEAVTVDANGNITINTFTAGTSANIIATAGSESVVLKVNMKLEASISYEQTTAEGTVGFSFVEPVLTKDPAGLNVVKWKSSRPEVATVVETTGEVALVSAGTTTITAYIEENNYYAYQEASYELTVNATPADLQTPWTLSVVTPGSESMAYESTGHKLEMTGTGTIKAGQVTEEIPGLTLSFGKYNDTTNWTVGTPESGYTTDIVAQGAEAIVDEETNYPTGGTYLGLEPTVNGVLSLDASYFASQNVVLVDKSTQTVVASYRAQTDEFADKEFSVPLQADHTYYLYNAGSKSDEYLNDALQIHAITFTPVFLDRIGHVVVNNNTYSINGEQLYENRHDYPTFSNVHDEEGGSVHYSSDSEVIYLDEDGNLVIDGEGTAILQAHVSHTDANGAECNSVAQCTVTYTKTALEFSKTSFEIGSNLISEFVEPTLNVPAELADLVTYSISGDGFTMDEDGNITVVPESGATATITATIGDNLYYTGSASYTLNITAKQVPYNVETTVTIPIGTVAYSLIYGENPVITLDDAHKDLQKQDDSDSHTWEHLISLDPSSFAYANIVAKFFVTKEKDGLVSADKSIVRINNKMQIDALTEGTTTVTIPAKELVDANGATYLARTIVITVNVVKDEESDYYNAVYNATEGNSNATYRTWNFHQGFDATELQSYVGNYNPLYNEEQSAEAETFKTHLPNPNEFWTYDSEANTLTSNVVYSVTDNEVDRTSIAFIANEPMNSLTQTTMTYNAYGSSSGTITDVREVGSEKSWTFDEDDKNVLTFFTFRTDDGWTGDNLHTVSNIKFNTSTSLCGITGVNNEQSATPYKALYLESQQGSAVRVNDIKPGMWMSVIADNTTAGDNFGRVQNASDGAETQALATSIYNSYADSKDTNWDKFNYNRVTNIFPYQNSGGTTQGIEPNGANNITNIMVGYPAGMGTMNVGGGEKSPKINNIQRTYGYATFVSPYNIDLTGQTALKAYICDYYGTENNLVHMVQIKHIPANTPVMLKGYARDMYVLYISEGNKEVPHGISEEVFAKNRLVGALEDGMMVQPTEEGLAPDGGVTTWHNLGLTQNKFRTFTVPSSIAKGRAYLRITQEEYEDLYAAHVSATAASTSAKIVFEDSDFDYSADEKPTGIEEVETNKITMGNGYYYNLNGVRINGKPTQKGIYILNGKKIVVR